MNEMSEMVEIDEISLIWRQDGDMYYHKGKDNQWP